MSTRSVTTVRSRWAGKSEYNNHAQIYRHHDGYPEGHGKWLFDFLNERAVVNGITGQEPKKYANGPGRLAAQIVSALFVEDHSPDLLSHTRNCGQEYEYRIDVDFGEGGGSILITVFDGAICEDAEILFTGTVTEFGAWIVWLNGGASAE